LTEKSPSALKHTEYRIPVINAARARAVAASWGAFLPPLTEPKKDSVKPGPIVIVGGKAPAGTLPSSKDSIRPGPVVIVGKMPPGVPPFVAMPGDAGAIYMLGGGSQSTVEDCHAVLERFNRHMAAVASANASSFATIPQYTLKIGPHRVMFGSPLKTLHYDSIPVYVSEDSGPDRLVIAYRSCSHGCWRRFAGRIFGIDPFGFMWNGAYWKGQHEQLQNFDYRIQKTLDAIFDSVPGKPAIGPDGSMLPLDDLGITAESVAGTSGPPYEASRFLLFGSETEIQNSMLSRAVQYDVISKGRKPHQLLCFWWEGSLEDPYGRHVNMMVRSADGRYLYCFALTDDGIFAKYVQPGSDGAINCAGAPRRTVLIRDEFKWILTPILQYGEESDLSRWISGFGLDAHATCTGARAMGDRVRIYGLHEYSKSPFFELNNGMSEYCRLLRAENYAAVDSALRRIISKGGMLPQSSALASPPAIRSMDVDDRMQELLEAFHLYSKGSLDDEAKKRLRINGRECALLKRYHAFMGSQLHANDETALELKRAYVRRFRVHAERYVFDQNKR